nr:MAG TPA: hypothetical protein [Caudoviricetes sp.]
MSFVNNGKRRVHFFLQICQDKYIEYKGEIYGNRNRT